LLWFGKLSNKRKEGNIAEEIIHDELKPDAYASSQYIHEPE